MTARQKTVLGEFARHGGLLVPGDNEVKARCKELTKLKFMRPQPFIDGKGRVGEARVIGVAYQITAKGKKAAHELLSVPPPAETLAAKAEHQRA